MDTAHRLPVLWWLRLSHCGPHHLSSPVTMSHTKHASVPENQMRKLHQNYTKSTTKLHQNSQVMGISIYPKNYIKRSTNKKSKVHPTNPKLGTIDPSLRPDIPNKTLRSHQLACRIWLSLNIYWQKRIGQAKTPQNALSKKVTYRQHLKDSSTNRESLNIFYSIESDWAG